MADDGQGRSGGRNPVVLGLVGCGCLGLLVVGGAVAVWMFGVAAAIAIPNFVSAQLRAKRAEVPGNVDGIRIAELSYDAAFDGYVPAGSELEARSALSLEPRAWEGGKGWSDLGWQPDGPVRGGYWVETTPGGFTVHGLIDADGDGVPAEYIATESSSATLLSGPNVF